MEWNEAGVLGEYNPLFAIRGLSATQLTKERQEAFAQYPGLQAAWTTELEESEGTQSFLNATQTNPLLEGMKVNLYKCFIPLAWRLASPTGVQGLVHPEGPFEDPDGGRFREELYQRLRLHLQFQNEFQLFVGTNDHGRMRFGLHVYGNKQLVGFRHISNLFAPTTVDACYQHDGSGSVGGIKDAEGNWNVSGHRDRIVFVDQEKLTTFAQLYDERGTPALAARLPAIHAGKLSLVLEKLAAYPSRLGNLSDKYFSTPSTCWNEKGAQDAGTITRRTSNSDEGFSDAPRDWILSGPHFFIGTPFNKTPRRVCTAN